MVMAATLLPVLLLSLTLQAAEAFVPAVASGPAVTSHKVPALASAAVRRGAGAHASAPPDALVTASPAPPNTPPVKVMPCGDDLDRRISALAIPAILNFLILPITNSVDLFFIGKLQNALAVAGQAAANQIFSTAAWATSVIPTVTTPRVAKARAKGDEAEVQAAVGEAIFVSVTLSALVALVISFRQRARDRRIELATVASRFFCSLLWHLACSANVPCSIFRECRACSSPQAVRPGCPSACRTYATACLGSWRRRAPPSASPPSAA